jgi:hypothetical protein
MGLETNNKNVLFAVNGQPKIQHYFVIIVVLGLNVRHVVSVANRLLEILQWFVITTRINVPNVEVMFR